MKITVLISAVLLIAVLLVSCTAAPNASQAVNTPANSVSAVLESAAQADVPTEEPVEEAETTVEEPEAETSKKTDAAPAADGAIDVDLTQMSATMVYAEVSNMMTHPKEYVGKTVKMSGDFNIFKSETDIYYACVIRDATACCAQGLEFVLSDGKAYPKEYGTPIVVTGVFDTYYEGDAMYCHLTNAALEA